MADFKSKSVQGDIMKSISMLLNDNPRNVFLEISNHILLFCDDLLKNPKTSKYRSLSVGCDLIQERFLPVSGAIECLFSMGYEEGGDYFLQPPRLNLDHIKKFREKLSKVRTECMERCHNKIDTSSCCGRRAGTGYCLSPPHSKEIWTPPLNTISPMMSEREFFDVLVSLTRKVLQYENSDLKKFALSCVPVQELNKKAAERYSSAQKANVDIRDCLLLILLDWFKNSFFLWVDSPICSQCRVATVNKGKAHPSHEEMRWDARRVEMYACPQCQKYVRFPRYNHPRKLLETRQGRCGEWANCFTLLCRALDFEARYVNDWNDHVWTEVYSLSQNRWLHCDPCENICDAPLIYEAGWKKKLNYVISFSKDEIQDVTWRYSANHREVLGRRQLCRESWLLEQLTAFSAKLQESLNPKRKGELLQRKVAELAEFLCARPLSENEYGGRTSGSMAWRIARGEANISHRKMEPFTFHLKPAEMQMKYFHIRYSASEDKYVRLSDKSSEIKEWRSCVYEENNIFRKIEYDWKVVYLARRENSKEAQIKWRFDLSSSEKKVESVILSCNCAKFENGKIEWKLETENKSLIFVTDNGPVITDDFKGASVITLSAHLSGGQGPQAWQHAQLFRQPLNSSEYPLDIKITFH